MTDKMDVDEVEELEAIDESAGDTTGTPKQLGQPSASEEGASPYPKMALCQDIHKMMVGSVPVGTTADAFVTKILTQISQDLENPALYESVVAQMGTPPVGVNPAFIWAPADLEAKKAAHTQHLAELNKNVEEAKEQAGDMEVLDARVEIARFAAKALTEDQALEAYAKLLELPKISSRKKIDAMMESSRVASFYGNQKKASEFIDSVSGVCVVFCAEFNLVYRRDTALSLSHTYLYFFFS